MKIADFGVFVELAPQLEGLIHVSEIFKEKTERIKDHLKLGDKLHAVVVSMDKKARKIALSAKLAHGTKKEGEDSTKKVISSTERTSIGDLFAETLQQATDKKSEEAKTSKVQLDKDKTKTKEKIAQEETETKDNFSEDQSIKNNKTHKVDQKATSEAKIPGQDKTKKAQTKKKQKDKDQKNKETKKVKKNVHDNKKKEKDQNKK